MKKKKLLLSSLLMLMSVGMAHGQTACIYVQKSGEPVSAVGSLGVSVESQNYTLSFDASGNAIMTVGESTTPVATVPVTDGNGGELCADFTSTAASVSKTISHTYATIYSPFQLVIPEGVVAYAPTYDATNKVLKLTSSQKYEADAIIPAGTGLILKNNGTFTFGFSTGTATATYGNALSGSALTITTPSGGVYTLGTGTNNGGYGFYSYTGANLNPGFAYLTKENAPQAKAGISFVFDDVTAISSVDASTSTAQASKDGKFVINGKIVILKGGKMYNLNGQEVK